MSGEAESLKLITLGHYLSLFARDRERAPAFFRLCCVQLPRVFCSPPPYSTALDIQPPPGYNTHNHRRNLPALQTARSLPSNPPQRSPVGAIPPHGHPTPEKPPRPLQTATFSLRWVQASLPIQVFCLCTPCLERKSLNQTLKCRKHNSLKSLQTNNPKSKAAARISTSTV